MKILERLPIDDEPTLILIRGDVYQLWKNQAIIWVSFAETLTPFPAILDSGHSHNLSIASQHPPPLFLPCPSPHLGYNGSSRERFRIRRKG
jgi:hypothetical protein